MITTALLILDLGLVAGQDFVTIAAVVGADRTSPPPFLPYFLCDFDALTVRAPNLASSLGVANVLLPALPLLSVPFAPLACAV
jgi:hypothetical protein